MKSHARVVIIGGGMMGVGLLYHLALEGWNDCTLIEKGELTSGSTWHAAGQCPSFIADYNLAKMHHYSNSLYPRLEKMTGQATGWHGCGGIRFAITPEELDYFRLVEGIAANVGFRMQIIGPDEIKRLNPFVDTTGVIAGAWTLDDGHVDPAGCCTAMAIAARGLGATIIRHNRVTGINLLTSGEWEVITEQGKVVCEHVVNAGGCYAGRIGAWVGLHIPITNMEHQYLVTGPIQEFADHDQEIPVMRDPYCSAYYRQEQNSALIGIYERTNIRQAWAATGGPSWEAENELFAPEFEPIMPWLERVIERMPIIADAGVMRVVNGGSPRSPDGNPQLGPAAGLRNFWLCCGASIGIAQGAGGGKYLAQMMIHGDAEINMLKVDPRRFGPFASKEYSSAKSFQGYKYMYILHLPGEERPAGRPAQTSLLYQKLVNKGCVHTEVFGWERPKWFSLDGRQEEYGFRRNNVFDVVAAECKAARERVCIRDLSSFAKFEISGPDALPFLNRLCANSISRRQGGIVLAHALSANGRIKSEFSITRLAEDRFYLLSAAAAELRDYDLLTQGKEDHEDVTILNLTYDYGVLLVVGPQSRDLLAKLTDAALDNQQFPWLTGRKIEVAGINLLALRINFVGELGWELHMPMAQLEHLYDQLWAAGENYGIVDLGSYAVNSLRLEKAYPGWGTELTSEITLIEAGLDRFADFKKEDFIGRQALLKQLETGLEYKLVYLEVTAEDADVRGGEPLLLGEGVIGVTTSGGYGHTVGKSLAFAYIQPHYAVPGSIFDTIILGARRPSMLLSEAVYDPENLRLKS
ncbi:MAG: FAD-dependent oxidoreductase [Anaerolineae bacterium]|nr:MAG: FAD-dependent oxidoreductase [Anaerolineae bacterium]